MGKKNKNKSENNNQGTTTYTGSIALSKLHHVILEKKGKKGTVKGLFIPIEKNHLIEGKEGAVYMPLRVIARSEEDQYGQHGFIAQSVDSKVWKEASDKKKEKLSSLPILGNIKCWDIPSNSGSNNDNSGSAGTYDENDDLPF